MSRSEKTSVVVIGGGLAGLTAAYQLKKKGINVRVLESSSRTGGVVSSAHVDGFELDLGPNSLVLTPALEEWIKELHLEDARMEAAASCKNRFLVKDKTLYALSPHPLKLLKSPYLSWEAKGRILTERFRGGPIGAGASADKTGAAAASGEPDDESVASFFSRRLGGEITEAIADPIFSGIYAGDIDRLSAMEAMPRLVQWERQYGSLTKGIFRQKEAMKGSRSIINFSGGMGRLTGALAAPLEGNIYTNVRVQNIESGPRGYRVIYRQGEEDHIAGEHTLEAGSLIYAAPAYALPFIPWFDELKTTASAIPYAPVRTVHLALRKDGLDLPDGFGFLVPTREHLSLLGCIFTSAIFPSKVPEGSALLTLMLGGAHRAADLLRDADRLQDAALQELKEILHISSPVRVLHEQTWRRAIPQKNTGYGRLKQSLLAFEEKHPGFFFAGNAVSGVSVGDTMEYAARIARLIGDL
jgi:oxygen-dependent protoporphyrinogen oxidase